MSNHKKMKYDLNSKGDMNERILDNIIIYIIPARFGKGRLNIFERQVCKHGGLLYNACTDSPTSVNYVITEETVTREIIQENYRVEEFINAIFVKCSWLIKIIKNKKIHTPCDSEIIYIHRNNIIPNNNTSLLYHKEKTAPVIISEVKTNLKENQSSQKNCNIMEKFACAHSSNNPKFNPNKHITDELDKLSSAYESKKDTWRAIGYQKAIAAIKNYHKQIETWEEARSIRGVGERLSDKIYEIIERGELRKVKEICDNEETKSLQLFMGVWGAGATTANNWYLQGFRTLEDLEKNAVLTRHQKIGLKYYEDFNERMTRSEVEAIADQIRSSAELIKPGLEIVVCGSYRRGKDTCGDVDVLITHKDGFSNKNLFIPLLDELKKTGFLTDDLVVQEHNGNQQKYLGVCKLGGESTKYRRLDIIVVPYKEFAPALMYFTGSAHFNRNNTMYNLTSQQQRLLNVEKLNKCGNSIKSMRLLATNLGMSLSEHGLRKGVVRDEKCEVTSGILLETPTEESIFQHLGLKYRPPNERNH